MDKFTLIYYTYKSNLALLAQKAKGIENTTEKKEMKPDGRDRRQH
jgi:hypothetical protein